jgi:hypothetical protein
MPLKSNVLPSLLLCSALHPPDHAELAASSRTVSSIRSEGRITKSAGTNVSHVRSAYPSFRELREVYFSQIEEPFSSHRTPRRRVLDAPPFNNRFSYFWPNFVTTTAYGWSQRHLQILWINIPVSNKERQGSLDNPFQCPTPTGMQRCNDLLLWIDHQDWNTICRSNAKEDATIGSNKAIGFWSFVR